MSQPGSSRGFSLTEGLVSVTIILTMVAIAIPMLNSSWAVYRLSGTATDVANILQRTRYEAIRTNTVLACRAQQQGTSWVVWADLNKNGALDATEPQMLLSGPVTFLADGVAPDPSSMGYTNTQVPQGSIAFDSRGGVSFGAGAPAVYVVYLGYVNDPHYGYKAVTVIPSGKTKVWTAASGGKWHSP